MEYFSILFCLLFFVSCQKDPAFPSVEFVQKDSVIANTPCLPCNGFTELCDKKYDEVVFVTTHNAFNADQGGSVNYLFPNQDFRISRQLKDGVRGFMVDVYPDPANANKPLVYHGFSWTGSEPFTNVLSEIKLFLDTNPREIVTIILECYVTSADISTSMQEAGLSPYLYTHYPGGPWESLKQIIESEKRLVVFSDVDDAGNFSWYHYMWDYCVETGYSAHSQQDLNCDYNRGDSSNTLFILNHFITQSLVGIGQPDQAAIINSNPFFINKARECSEMHGKIPNFLTVDFYAKGSVFEVARELNGVK